MRINLSENDLRINGRKCLSITIFQTPEGFKADVFGLEGWTYYKETEDKYFRKIKKVMRERKTIKFKKLIYSGIDLEDNSKLYTPKGYTFHLYAENKLNPLNYINIYLNDKNSIEVLK